MADIISMDNPQHRMRAVETLRGGGVICFPTETVCGVAALRGNDAGIRHLRRLKGRDADKPCQVLVSGAEDVQRLGCVVDASAHALMQAFWPGGLTLVLDTMQGGTEGVRCPAVDSLRLLIAEAGAPLVASSANRAGEQPAATIVDAQAVFGDEISLYLDVNVATAGVASTVARLSGGGDLSVFREGGISDEDLRRVLDGIQKG